MTWGDINYLVIGLVVAFWFGVKADLSFRDLLDFREGWFFFATILIWPVILAIYFSRRKPRA